jgi:hypothetical protein
MGSTLTTGSASSVVVINPGNNDNIFWQVGSSATLGSATAFQGTILAYTSITLVTGTTISCGRAIALNGAVTMDTNTVDIDNCASAPSLPEPATISLLVPGLMGVGVVAVQPPSFAGLGLCGVIAVIRRKRRL